jgi:hypothetical protein
MRTRKPIQAQSTRTLLNNVFPESFKFVSDKQSNGYKFINLLYGVEIDEAKFRLSKLYNDSFLDTMDYGQKGNLFSVLLSGIPSGNYVYGDGLPIKLTDVSEFDYGDPTRIIYKDYTSLSGIMPLGSNIVGLEYYRTTMDGAGYFLVNLDITQSDAVVSGVPSTIKVPIDREGLFGSGEYINYGISKQDYDTERTDDLLVPEDSSALQSIYPLTRVIRDENEVEHSISHYEPYHGWTRDINGTIVAVVDYPGDYYFNDDGAKTFHRTARNNPYGSGNYNTTYLNLRHTPISGTLHLYDVNILDGSGNATEIPLSGKTLYRYQSSNMLQGNIPGTFDPIYIGYDTTVPYDRGLYSEGASGVAYLTTSWDYVHEGSQLNTDNGLYEEVSSGNLTNIIKIINPYSRYIAEYQYETASKVKYFTSLESTKYVRLSGTRPIYTFDNTIGNLTPVNFEFSRDNTISDSQRKHIITFDGFEVRPNSRISSIDFNIPVTQAPASTIKDVTINLVNNHIGYSDEFLPTITGRSYWMNIPFLSDIGLNQEADVSGSGNHLDYIASSEYRRLKINYSNNYGKRHEHTSGDQYYQPVNSGIYADDFYIKFGAKFRDLTSCELVDYYSNNRMIYLEILDNGRLRLTSNNQVLESRQPLVTTNTPFELLIHHVYTTDDTTFLNFDIYLSTGDFFNKLDIFKRDTTDAHYNETNRFKLFKNCNIDLDYFQIYGEIIYNGLG